MEQKTHKNTARLVAGFIILFAIVAGWRMISGSDYSGIVTPIFGVIIALVGFMHLTYKKILGLFKGGIKAVEVTTTTLAVLYVITFATSLALLMGWAVPILAPLTGWVLIITAIVAIPQAIL